MQFPTWPNCWLTSDIGGHELFPLSRELAHNLHSSHLETFRTGLPLAMLSKVVEEQSRALQLDALRSSHPVEVPIRHAKVPN